MQRRLEAEAAAEAAAKARRPPVVSNIHGYAGVEGSVPIDVGCTANGSAKIFNERGGTVPSRDKWR